MAVILALSSQVAHGHIGLSAALPVWQRLGHEVIALPTILLSNHPAHPSFTGERVAPRLLRRMLATLADAGHLASVDAVAIGYLPSIDHVRLAADLVDVVRQAAPNALMVCDPILGDEPNGLYLDRAAAEAIRDQIVPRADVSTPNAFELGWLTAQRISTISAAVSASYSLAGSSRSVITTSVPLDRTTLATVMVAAGTACAVAVTKQARVPHGTGDLFAALYVGHALAGHATTDSLSRAVAGTGAAIAASLGRLDLDIVANLDRILGAKAIETIDLAVPTT